MRTYEDHALPSTSSECLVHSFRGRKGMPYISHITYHILHITYQILGGKEQIHALPDIAGPNIANISPQLLMISS